MMLIAKHTCTIAHPPTARSLVSQAGRGLGASQNKSFMFIFLLLAKRRTPTYLLSASGVAFSVLMSRGTDNRHPNQISEPQILSVAAVSSGQALTNFAANYYEHGATDTSTRWNGRGAELLGLSGGVPRRLSHRYSTGACLTEPSLGVLARMDK